MINVYFAAGADNVKIPTKRDEDAGYDIYPYFNHSYMIIYPNDTVIIPTKLYSAVDKGYYFQLAERGSTGTLGLGQRCGVIDSGYRGEWMVPITNHSDTPIAIVKEKYANEKDMEKKLWYMEIGYLPNENCKYYPYEKAICQAIVLPVPQTVSVEISMKELNEMSSERGAGSLGSSGK